MICIAMFLWIFCNCLFGHFSFIYSYFSMQQ